MLHTNNGSLPRCPKCNEPMGLLKDSPQFAQFLPWRSFTCERCRNRLTYPPDEGDGHSYQRRRGRQ
jgi:hypothetical protein